MSFKIIKNFKKLLKYLYQNFFPEYMKVRLSALIDPLPKNRLRATAAIRIDDYFKACNKKLSKNDDINSNNYYLHEAFKKYLVRSNLIDDNWWSDFIILINLPEGSKFQKINKSLIDRIEYSNFNSLEYFEVLDIYGLCIRLSLFELGYHIRQKSLKIALAYSLPLKKNENWKLKAKLSALLEIGNFSEFDKLFPLFQSRRKHEKYFLNYLRRVLKDSKRSLVKDLSSDIDSEKDLKFRKFVENKKIVVVSPKLVNTKDGYTIDKADIIVRTNYKIGDPIIKGSRSDISYFNRETSQYIDENGCSEWPLDVKWTVGRAWNYMETILKRLSSDGVNIENLNVRALKRVDNALFYGSLLMLPNIIVDLSRYNPREIFLYHFDLLLTKDRIPGYLIDVNSKKELHLKLIKNLAVHDPIINFVILKLFWKQGFIKGDYHFEEVMKMETEDYMKNLQKNYQTGNSFEIDRV